MRVAETEAAARAEEARMAAVELSDLITRLPSYPPPGRPLTHHQAHMAAALLHMHAHKHAHLTSGGSNLSGTLELAAQRSEDLILSYLILGGAARGVVCGSDLI